MKNYNYLFKSYPSGTPEERWWRKVNREFNAGTYSVQTAVEVERRTGGVVRAHTIRPDKFLQPKDDILLNAMRDWLNVTDHPTGFDHELIAAMQQSYPELKDLGGNDVSKST